MLKRIQRQGTKIVKILCDLSYEDTLRNLNLFPLPYHRLQGGEILSCRILDCDFAINMSYLLLSS